MNVTEHELSWIRLNFFELGELGQIQDALFLNLPHVKQPGYIYSFSTSISKIRPTMQSWAGSIEHRTVRTPNRPNSVFWAKSPKTSFEANSTNTEQSEQLKFWKFPNRANSPNTYRYYSDFCESWSWGQFWPSENHTISHVTHVNVFTAIILKCL